jgi:hypothetical protein
MLIVTIMGTFARDKSFGLVDIDQREMEGTTEVGRNAKASSALIQTKYGVLLPAASVYMRYMDDIITIYRLS